MLTFITLLVALLIERLLWHGEIYRKLERFEHYHAKITASRWLGWLLLSRPWGIVILITPLLLFMLFLQFNVAPLLGGLFEILFGLLCLLFSLGPRELGRDVENYLNAKSAGQSQQAHQLAQHFSSTHHSDPSDDSQVSQGILVGANHRLIGPILWFLLLGAVGAMSYRLMHHLAYAYQASLTIRSAQDSKTIFYWMDWLPARITAAGYAIVGHFEQAISAWKTYAAQQTTPTCTTHDQLIWLTGQAALANDPASPTASIENHLRLVWRSLTFWIALIGLVTLFGAL